MGWDKTDDQFGIHRKVIRIPKKQRFAAVGLWTLAKNYSARSLTDGVLEAHELEELDAPLSLVAELVRVVLWHTADAVCDSCIVALAEKGHTDPIPAGAIVIHHYLDYNPSRAEVLAAREAERVRKASQRESGRRPSGSPGGTTPGTPAGSDPESGHPVPVPSPSPLTDVTNLPASSPEIPVGAEGLDGALLTLVSEKSPIALDMAKRSGVKDLYALHGLLETAVGEAMTPRGAIELVDAILTRSKHSVVDVDAYVATACREKPASVREAFVQFDIGAVA